MSAPITRPMISIGTRWRDVFTGDVVVGDNGVLLAVESVHTAPAGLKITLRSGVSSETATVDPDDLAPVLHPDPRDVTTPPRRVVDCPMCGGRGRIRQGGVTP